MNSKIIDPLTIFAKHLKCDATGCYYVETIPELTAALIGKPCPKCGANLLTTEDYEAWQNALFLIKLFNVICGPVESTKDDVSKSVILINPRAGSLHVDFKK